MGFCPGYPSQRRLHRVNWPYPGELFLPFRGLCQSVRYRLPLSGWLPECHYAAAQLLLHFEVTPMQPAMARATIVGEIAGALTIRAEEASILADLKAGSEDAYAWLIAHYHQPVYGLVYRILSDPADAADTTQEVFLKVFRGMKNFNGEASLKTWIYRIAVHEASNQRRWWFRHKRKETSMEAEQACEAAEGEGITLCDTLADDHDTPYECFAHEEVRAKVEAELKEGPEPYRTTVV